MKPALLVIDMQKAFSTGKSKESMEAASDCINAAASFFRKKGLPVFFIHQVYKESGAFPGEPGFEFIDALQTAKSDYRITKEYPNSFNKTNLFELLRKTGTDTVIVSGFCAEYCVLSTYRGALDLDLVPVILKKGIASGVEKNIGFVESVSDIVTVGALLKFLENA